MITTVDNIVTSLLDMKNTYTRGDLTRINDALKQRFDSIAYHTAQSFKFGDKVQFRTKQGALVKGTVRKVNSKTVQVYAPATNVNWKVTASLLTADPD